MATTARQRKADSKIVGSGVKAQGAAGSAQATGAAISEGGGNNQTAVKY